MIFTGLRPGELIGLQWSDIDFSKGVMSVKRSVGKEIKFNDEGKATERSAVITATKTVLSARTFKAPQIVLSAISEWLSHQQETEAETGLSLTDSKSFVFCNKNGTMRTYSGLRSLLRRFIQKYG